MSMRLKDKVCLITGAGKGIGAATAIKFAKEGALVEIADVGTTAGMEMMTKIRNHGGATEFSSVDVTDEQFIRRSWKTI